MVYTLYYFGNCSSSLPARPRDVVTSKNIKYIYLYFIHFLNIHAMKKGFK